jgi:Ni,Fe-hydrogenase III large subunit
VDDAVLVAERVEGIASVAHALAFCHAVEAAAGTLVPERARLLRVAHAELERLAHHLDVAMRLTEAAGLAVATSRFAWHKEEAMRLRSALCGHRFGRGVVVPGGVAAPPLADPGDVARRLTAWHARARADLVLAMRTPSFVDRLRGTGVLAAQVAARWAALGPLGRASGRPDDARWDRPTDAYPELRLPPRPALSEAGDVMARSTVRWHEVDAATDLAVQALDRLAALGPGPSRTVVEPPDGEVTAHGWAEAAHGEVLHALTLRDGVVQRCFARSPSLHNLAVLHDVFHGDVFTDLAFIEASFGLGYAGVAM